MLPPAYPLVSFFEDPKILLDLANFVIGSFVENLLDFSVDVALDRPVEEHCCFTLGLP